MSLAAFAARKSLCMLLRGNTWAQGRVLDAPVEPIEGFLTGDRTRPIIAVYTGAYVTEARGRDILGAEGYREFVIQLYFPPVTAVGEMDDLDGWYPNPLAGAAPALDILARQIEVALQANLSEWNAVWTGLVASYSKISDVPILMESEKQGLRIPCREITIRAKMFADPAYGVPLKGHYLKFYTLLQDTEPELAEVFKVAAEAPANIPDWQVAMASMGWTPRVAEAMGISAFAEPQGNVPVPLQEVTLHPTTIETVEAVSKISEAGA